MSVSRRRFFKTLMQGLAAGAIGEWTTGLARSENPPKTSGSLITRVMRPFDAETPVRELTSWLTPNERLFVRSHFGPPTPETIDWKSLALRSGLWSR